MLTTARAPAVFAIRVAVPLCWTTLVFPSMVVIPPAVENLKLFLAILDLASLAWMRDWISASESLEAGTATRLWAGGTAAGRVCG